MGFLMKRGWRVLLLVLLFGLVMASRYYPKIDRIEVNGARHYSAKDIAALAKVALDQPFLWVTSFSAQALSADPWIAQAKIIRHWPSTIRIEVRERQAFLSDGVQGYASDGTVLPNVPQQALGSLIQLEGWGPARLEEALELARLLADRQAKVISYSPAGFTIQYSGGEVFTPSLAALKMHWASFLSQQGARAYVYPWGVSARHD
jgi:cell division protein FtsQ